MCRRPSLGAQRGCLATDMRSRLCVSRQAVSTSGRSNACLRTPPASLPTAHAAGFEVRSTIRTPLRRRPKPLLVLHLDPPAMLAQHRALLQRLPLDVAKLLLRGLAGAAIQHTRWLHAPGTPHMGAQILPQHTRCGPSLTRARGPLRRIRQTVARDRPKFGQSGANVRRVRPTSRRIGPTSGRARSKFWPGSPQIGRSGESNIPVEANTWPGFGTHWGGCDGIGPAFDQTWGNSNRLGPAFDQTGPHGPPKSQVCPHTAKLLGALAIGVGPMLLRLAGGDRFG